MINVKRFLKNELSETAQFAIQKGVNLSLKKEWAYKAQRHRKDIIENYEYFSANAVKIYEYLLHDFNIHKYGGISIKKEIKDIKENIKKCSGRDNKWLRKVNHVKLGSTLLKWQSLSIIIDEYPKLLDVFEKVAGNQYKDVTVDDERQLITGVSWLKEDFSLIKDVV